MRIAPFVVLGLMSVVVTLCACGNDPPPPPPAPVIDPEPDISYQRMPATKGYPLKTCVVTGKDLTTLGKPAFVIAYKGYEVQLCEKKCLWEFAKDPEKYVKMINPKAILPPK